MLRRLTQRQDPVPTPDAQLFGLPRDDDAMRPLLTFPTPKTESTEEQHLQGCRNAVFDLRAAVEQVRRGASVFVELTGPPGSGKSQLLATFAQEQTSSRILVLSGACRRDDWRPFSLLRRIFDDHLAARRSLSQSRQRAVAASLASAAGHMLPWLSMLVPDFADISSQPSLPVFSGDAQHSFVGGVATFVLNYILDNRPAVILIDDAHWLEGSSARVLSRIIAKLGDSNTLLVLAHSGSKESTASIQKLLQLQPHERPAHIRLGALSVSEARSVVEDVLHADWRGGSPSAQPAPLGPIMVEHLLGLSDGTPLSLSTLVGHALETKCLIRAHGSWQLDHHGLAEKTGSRSPVDLAANKLKRLSAETQPLLRTLAVAGQPLPALLLAYVHHTSIEEIWRILAPATNQSVLRNANGTIDFIQNALRLAVCRHLGARALRAEHLRLALALQEQPNPQPEDDFEVARHFAEAGDSAPPGQVHQAARRAALQATAQQDSHRALFFLELAEEACSRMGRAMSYEELSDIADSCWHNGYAQRSEHYNMRALETASDPQQRSSTLGRLAWVQHCGGETEKAQRNIELALQTLGSASLQSTAATMPRVLGNWALTRAWRETRPSEGPQEKLELQCAQYLRAYRILTETGRAVDGFLALIQADQLARRMQPCDVASRALSSGAGLLTLLGLHGQANKSLSYAEQLARELNAPIALARCHVMRHISAAWRGDIDNSRKHAHLFAVEHGHFVDLGDYCLLCLGMVVLETSLGEPDIALTWIDRIISRAVLHGQAPAFVSVVREAAHATLTTLGREHQFSHIEQRLSLFAVQTHTTASAPHLMSYYVKLHQFAERGDTGPDFDRLVSEFESHATNTKLESPARSAGYMHILHARIHQGIRGGHGLRLTIADHLKTLFKSRINGVRGNLAQAHKRVGEAAIQWFVGKNRAAEALLSEAEQLAHDTPCPWVLFTTLRIRAHLYREQGRIGAATNQAQHAYVIARAHHHVNRCQWIVEDFPEGIFLETSPATLGSATGKTSPPRMRRHLDTLLRISRTGSADLSPETQATFILEEVSHSLDAETGHLMFPKAGKLQKVANYEATSTTLSKDAPPTWVVEAAYGTGQLVRLKPGETSPGHDGVVQSPTLAAPLVLRGEAIGVICLQREASDAHFDAHEGELLLDLSSQVPIALELAKSLRARETLEENLKQSQKMEAIGQLAGGIAHDFNNLLSTIQLSGSALQNSLPKNGQGREEVADILDVAARGSALTNQLLTFAKRKTAPPQQIDINSNVTSLVPMLTRLVGGQLRIHTDLHDKLPDVIADPVQIDQVLLNLITNARDATNREGRAQITTGCIEITQKSVAAGFPLPPGTYVTLAVSDNGSGIPQEVQQKVFEPFYSTKPSHQGTGLGLASVYGIVQQHNGHIELQSAADSGTTFTVYLPTAAPANDSSQVAPNPTVPGEDSPIQHLVVVAPPGDARAQLANALLSETRHDVFSVSNQAELYEIFDDLGGDVCRVVYTNPPLAKDLAALQALCPAPNLTAATVFNVTGNEIDELKAQPVPVQCFPAITSVDAMVRAVLQSLETTPPSPTPLE